MATIIAGIPMLQGRSARATGDISMKIANGASLDFGGAYGGIGSTTRIWTYHGRLVMPF
jgi:hypothetical protein